jgi:CRISPR-associated protein (TIGR03986 family)
MRGLSGKLICTLTTETPLMIGGKRDKEKSPCNIDFFERNGTPVIPGSSLRGALRSVFETLTNSCYSVFSEDTARLHFRPRPEAALRMKAGKIINMPSGREPGILQVHDRAWIACSAKGVWINISETDRIELRHINSVPDTNQSFQAKVLEIPNRFVRRKIKDEYVWKPQPGPFRLVVPDSYPIGTAHTGILKITGDNLKDVHGNSLRKRERFFYPVSPEQFVAFEEEEANEYNAILESQKKILEARPKQFEIRENESLQVGSLVYFYEEHDPNGRASAKHLSRVEIPRRFYEKGPFDLLPKKLRKCSSYEELCPACRLFGFVDKQNALASRISFSDAAPVNDQSYQMHGPSYSPLQALGTPHPISVNLYLKNPKNKDLVKDYDNGGALRGRKFYFRHGESKPQDHLKKYERTDPHTANIANNIRPLFSGQFQFEVNFTNLEEWELGALIYTLELEGNMRHAFGMAKPFGFGRAQITIDSKLSQVLTNGHYESFDEKFSVPEIELQTQKAVFLSAFKGKVKAATGMEFNELVNVKKLKTIMTPLPAKETRQYPGVDGFKEYMKLRKQALPEL